MACFIVPAAEAVITTIAAKAIEKKERKEDSAEKSTVCTRFSHKLKWLNNMLWGGSALLAFEHIWHGELVPWFPFLTNAVNPADRAEMILEMATAGISMAVAVTAVWGVIAAFASAVEKKEDKQSKVEVN